MEWRLRRKERQDQRRTRGGGRRGGDIWTQQGTRDDKGDAGERPLGTWKRARERDRKRGGRGRQGGREGESLESAVECRWQEEDRRKQAAIVSDDSLVARSLPRVAPPPPRPSPSLFLSLSPPLTVVLLLVDRLTKSVPTSLPQCDNLIEGISPAPFLALSLSFALRPPRALFKRDRPRLTYEHTIHIRICRSAPSAQRGKIGVPRCDSNYARGARRTGTKEREPSGGEGEKG